MHEHVKPHIHELKYCEQCDTVYCDGCGKEWTLKVNYVLTSTPALTPPYIVTCGDAGHNHNIITEISWNEARIK